MNKRALACGASRVLLVGAVLAVVVGVATAQTWNYELVHAFCAPGQSAGSLIQASDGYFYGTTDYGGTNGVGTVYRMDSAGNALTIHSFGYTDGAVPQASLIQSNDGFFYGTTSQGGASNLGVVFRMDSAGNVTRLHSFAGVDGATPMAALLQGSDGSFYGTTLIGGVNDQGTVFRVDASGNLTTIHFFQGAEGARPRTELVEGTDGALYGTTSGYDPPGSAFRIDSGGTFTVLHVFGHQDDPSALIQAADGYFYGTTFFGGTGNNGAIFRIDASGTFSNVADLIEPVAPLVQAADGSFWGTDLGGPFRFDPSSGVTRTGFDLYIDSALIQALDGTFYGAGQTVFRFDESGDLETLHVFGGAGPANPLAPLIRASDGRLYGTTYHGGQLGADCEGFCGTVFRLNPDGTVTTVHAFDWEGVHGSNPAAPLVQASDGSFYGTTSNGGANAIGGTIFKIDSSYRFTLLHTFGLYPYTEGYNPSAGLIQAADGNFYGTWSLPPLLNPLCHGAAFRMTPAGEVSTFHCFINEGADPVGVIQGADGDFYGTTRYGPGQGGVGTVFKIDSQGMATTLHEFSNSGDGSYPQAPLIQGIDGSFYGTTSGSCCGEATIFKIDSFGTFSTLFDLGEQGSFAALIQAPDGTFYGTTEGGGIGQGSVFSIDPSDNFSTLHSFSGIDGAHSAAALLLAPDGALYGTTADGGPGYGGVIFRLTAGSLALNSVTPSGPASAGAAVEALGGGFLSGATMTVKGVLTTDLFLLDPTFLYAATPSLMPGSLNDVSVTNPGGASATLVGAYFADFLDLPQSDIFHDSVEAIFRAGVTAGCGGGNYCRDAAALRKQMAVFVLKAKEGSSYAPPPAVGIFTDVPASDPFAPWIEELYHRGVVAGCGEGTTYCPNDPVLRQQMAVFLLKTLLGSTYAPPPCSGVFTDVPCSSPFAVWIEDLYTRGIAGCGGGDYCPGNPATRGQMAAFLAKTFGL